MESQVLKNMPPEILRQRQTAHIAQTQSVPTIAVHLKNSDHKEAVIINTSDFNDELHERIDPAKAEAERKASFGEEKDGQSVHRYKVFRDFKYLDVKFCKDEEVDLRHEIALAISQRFRCIWDVEKLGELDDKPKTKARLENGSTETDPIGHN